MTTTVAGHNTSTWPNWPRRPPCPRCETRRPCQPQTTCPHLIPLSAPPNLRHTEAPEDRHPREMTLPTGTMMLIAIEGPRRVAPADAQRRACCALNTSALGEELSAATLHAHGVAFTPDARRKTPPAPQRPLGTGSSPEDAPRMGANRAPREEGDAIDATSSRPRRIGSMKPPTKGSRETTKATG